MECIRIESKYVLSSTMFHITAQQFLRRGLEAVGFDLPRQQRTKHTTNLTRFRAAFGVGPAACSAIFTDLQTTQIPAARIERPNSYFFLVAMNWLATYKKEAEMAGFFKADEKTLRDYIRRYVSAVAALKEQKIVWRDLNNVPKVFVLSVDGVHFRTYEPRKEPSTEWCSHKFNAAGVTYEIAMSVYEQ